MNLHTLAFLLLVDQTRNAEKKTHMQFVLASQTLSECLQVVDQNASQVLNVRKTKHVFVRNVSILVQALVV
jgi:hypothetical protein